MSGKVLRWVDHLSEEQVIDLVATFDRVLYETGINGRALKEALRKFVIAMPGRRARLGAHGETPREVP